MMTAICLIYYLVHKLNADIYFKKYTFPKTTVLKNHTERISKYPGIRYTAQP
jgi:hypothetical protein